MNIIRIPLFMWGGTMLSISLPGWLIATSGFLMALAGLGILVVLLYRWLDELDERYTLSLDELIKSNKK